MLRLGSSPGISAPFSIVFAVAVPQTPDNYILAGFDTNTGYTAHSTGHGYITGTLDQVNGNTIYCIYGSSLFVI